MQERLTRDWLERWWSQWSSKMRCAFSEEWGLGFYVIFAGSVLCVYGEGGGLKRIGVLGVLLKH